MLIESYDIKPHNNGEGGWCTKVLSAVITHSRRQDVAGC